MARFKNGVSINKVKLRQSDGRPIRYLRISAGPLRGQYVHRLIVAARIGRPLCSWEHIDHKNGNTLDDRSENLSDPITAEEHARLTNGRALAALEKRQEAERRKTQLKNGRREDDRAVGKAIDFMFGANKGEKE